MIDTQVTGKRLIAAWVESADPTVDPPVSVRWSDGTPATMDDFARIDGSTQSDPDFIYSQDGGIDRVEFSYAMTTDATKTY